MGLLRRLRKSLVRQTIRPSVSARPRLEQLERRVLLDAAEVVWSTYVGTGYDDFTYGLATDSHNSVIVTGETEVPHQGGSHEASFVIKGGPGGSLAWYVLLDNHGYGNRLAVASDDNIVTTGCTDSAGWLNGGFDTLFGGYGDGYVVKLDPDGNILWGTYLGGDQFDEVYGVAIAPDGTIVVCGNTGSGNWCAGKATWDGSYGGRGEEGGDGFVAGEEGGDGFVAKISADGQQLLWATYIGGAADDYADSVAVDAQGNIYVVGQTASPGWTQGGFDTSYAGAVGEFEASDGYVVKLSASGQHIWSTYIGGSYPDMVFDVTVDPDGNPVIVGGSGPIGWIKGGYDTSFAGQSTKQPDGFVAKIKSDGTGAVWGSYLGGSNLDVATAVAVNGLGDIVVAGTTASSGWIKDGPDTSYNGDWDAFVVVLTNTGGHLWSTYIGGAEYEWAHEVAVDGNNDILVSGETESPGWTQGGYDTQFDGGGLSQPDDEDEGDEPSNRDGFVVKLHQLASHPPTMTTIDTLTDARQDWPYQITYQALLEASDAQDADGDQIQFQLDSISSGTLKDAQGNKLSAGATLQEGQTWTWQPPAGKNGLINAFKVKAFDGQKTSSAIQVKVQVGQIPDLQPMAVDSNVWQSAAPGQEVDWTATVKNNATMAQEDPWTIQWYLSTDNKLSAKDILIGQQTYDDDIDPKDSIYKVLTAAVPQVTPGQYYVIAKVTSEGPESNIKNNIKASTDRDWFGQVAPDDQEDNDTMDAATDLGYLAGTNVYTSRTIDESGDEDWYKFTTLNKVAKGHKIQIDFTNTEGDLALALYDEDGNLLGQVSDKTGNSEQIALTPLALQEGTYYVKVWSDHDDVSRNYKLTIAAPAGPDLTVTSVDSSVWQSAAPGQEVDWKATIKNNGTGYQRADWQVEWYLSTDNKLSANDILIGQQTYDDDIAPKASVDKVFSAEVPDIPTAAQYYLIAKVTTEGPESNIKNNTKASKDRDWFGQVAPDDQEDNDSMDAAIDLRSTKTTIDNLTLDSVDDEDWYKFELTATGKSSQKVQIDFNNTEGDLALELYKEDGTLVKLVDTTGNSHQISLKNQKAGTYYIKVYSPARPTDDPKYLADVCRKYKLTLVL